MNKPKIDESGDDVGVAQMTVHALRGGLPLCRFSDDVPRDWPDGHRWTDVADVEHITCAECKRRATAMLAATIARLTDVEP
jgi:hypothetical protein